MGVEEMNRKILSILIGFLVTSGVVNVVGSIGDFTRDERIVHNSILGFVSKDKVTMPMDLDNQIEDLIQGKTSIGLDLGKSSIITLELTEDNDFINEKIRSDYIEYRFFEGKVEGCPTSRISLTLNEKEKTLDGYIKLGKGLHGYMIESVEDSKETSHIMYRTDGYHFNPEYTMDLIKKQQSLPPEEESGKYIATLRWAVFLDGTNGYDTNWLSDIYNIRGVYRTEVDIDIIVDSTTTLTDATTNPDISDWGNDNNMLNDFDDWSIPSSGDKAVLLTHQTIGSIIGQAYTPGNYAWFSTSGDDWQETIVGSHELGHNYDASHDDADWWNEWLWWPTGYHNYHTIMWSPYYDSTYDHMVDEFSSENADTIQDNA